MQSSLASISRCYQQYFDYHVERAAPRLRLLARANIRSTVSCDLIAQALPWYDRADCRHDHPELHHRQSARGAIAAWQRAPRWMRAVATPFVLLTGVPPVLLGVLLLFFIGFKLKLLPLGGAYSIGIIPSWSWEFALDIGGAPDSAGARADIGLGRRLGAVDARHGGDHPGRGLRQFR